MSEPASLESISLRGMRFHALVGILPHEQEHPQPLEVDVTVWRAMPAPRGAPAGVLDYRELYDLVATHVAMQPVHYLEELAHALADQIDKMFCGRSGPEPHAHAGSHEFDGTRGGCAFLGIDVHQTTENSKQLRELGCAAYLTPIAAPG